MIVLDLIVVANSGITAMDELQVVATVHRHELRLQVGVIGCYGSRYDST
jgi:hypothetical protein